MNKKLTIAVIGCGIFSRNFINIFKLHPNTEKVYVCDLNPELAQKAAKDFDVEIIESFEAALDHPDINCIANFTRRHQHGDISIRALKAGKHVYSSVPMASTVEECAEIVRLVKETGLTYLIGETCYYYPCAMFCREAYKAGKFGKFQYGTSQYYHHIDDISYGQVESERGMSPMLYATHSTAMILSAVDSYVKRVTCVGNKTDDPTFKKGGTWDNEFINQYAFMELANGGIARVSEARSFAFGKPSSCLSSLYGTQGCYEFSNAQHLLYERDFDNPGREKIKVTDVSDYVNPIAMVENKNTPKFKELVANNEWQDKSPAQVQAKERERLPKEYENQGNGHMASHHFLIDDFCKAAYTGEIPVLNAWFAARCNIPGLIAIESARQGGIPLEVPDLGDAPIK